jgi:hypothetical protein
MNKTDLSDQLRNLFESLDVAAGAKDLTVAYDNDFYTRDYKQKLESPKASFSDDPLSLSCASWRIFKDEPERRWTNLDVVKATSDDRAMAQSIRDYYNQRYTMQVLKGRQLTEYQQKTAQFLSGLYHLKTDELGLLYKLPYFYVEDTSIDSVIESTQSYERPLNRTYDKYTLTPVKQIFRTRKSGEMVQFWYKDQDNHTVLIECRGTDSLLNMLRGLFSQPQIQVQSYVKLVAFDGPHEQKALKLFSWELVF